MSYRYLNKFSTINDLYSFLDEHPDEPCVSIIDNDSEHNVFYFSGIEDNGIRSSQTFIYKDGQPYIIRYTITTNGIDGKTLVNPIDTDVLAFDGVDFDIHLKAKFDWSNIQYASGTSTRINPILNLSANDANNKVNGFLVSFLSRGSQGLNNPWWNFSGTQYTSNYATTMRVTKYLNDSANTTYYIQKSPGLGNNKASGIGAAQNATGSDIGYIDITCRSNVFHISVTNEARTLQTVCQKYTSPYTNQDLDFGSALFDDVTVELGHWDSVVDGVEYNFNYEVLGLDIQKFL